MLKREVHTRDHFRRGSKKRLCFRVLDFLNVLAEMLDKVAKFDRGVDELRRRTF